MTTLSKDRIRIALQKSGRLSDDSINLLERCGIKFRKSKNQLFYHSENFPLDILLVRDDDIPTLVMDGICDFGIVGTNVLEESSLSREQNGQSSQVQEIQSLDFGACRLCIAVPEDYTYKNAQCLQSKRIATSYPALTKQFLSKNNISGEVIELTGSVEIGPRLGIADFICDLVSTGATLEANGLKEVETIFRSKAVLIKTNIPISKKKQASASLLERRLLGVLQASESKYIMLHAPRAVLTEIVALLPGVETPTVLNLEGDKNRVSVHAVCSESIFWDTLERLKEIGASSILVLPVEKMLA